MHATTRTIYMFTSNDIHMMFYTYFTLVDTVVVRKIKRTNTIFFNYNHI